jgi:hypothetical protein
MSAAAKSLGNGIRNAMAGYALCQAMVAAVCRRGRRAQ